MAYSSIGGFRAKKPHLEAIRVVVLHNFEPESPSPYLIQVDGLSTTCITRAKMLHNLQATRDYYQSYGYEILDAWGVAGPNTDPYPPNPLKPLETPANPDLGPGRPIKGPETAQGATLGAAGTKDPTQPDPKPLDRFQLIELD